jgi:hypothetical protein
MTKFTSALCVTFAVLAALAVPGLASATTGSYTVATWSQPQLYNEYLWSRGAFITPPATVPAGAVITAVSGYAGWNDNAPGGQHYEHAICFNTSSTCTVFPGTAANYWSIPSTPVGGALPAATTKIDYAARTTDGDSNPTTYPAINPPRYLTTSRGLTVYYTY